MKRLVALLICLTFLVPMAALADDTFYAIFGTLTSEEILGDPDTFTPMDESSGICFLVMDFTEKTIMLAGEDNEGKAYGMMWNDQENAMMFALLAFYTQNYADTDEMDPKTFVIGFKLTEDGDTTFINNAEDAAAVYEILNNSLNNQ